MLRAIRRSPPTAPPRAVTAIAVRTPPLAAAASASRWPLPLLAQRQQRSLSSATRPLSTPLRVELTKDYLPLKKGDVVTLTDRTPQMSGRWLRGYRESEDRGQLPVLFPCDAAQILPMSRMTPDELEALGRMTAVSHMYLIMYPLAS